MTSSQNRLKRPEMQPAPERGFAGRAPLVSGMLAKRDQLMASASLLKIASRAVMRREAESKYAKLAYTLAKEIRENRRSEAISQMIQESIDGLESAPQTKREALEIALRRRKVRAEIIEEREMSHFTIFKIRLDGQERSVPFPNDIMEGDALSNFEQVLSTAGIAGSNTDLMKSRKKESGSSRPPPEPIEVDLRRLENRKISYDGQINGKALQFTYYADEIGTSFGLDVGLKNGDLLREIDRRIHGLHSTYGARLDAAVIEQQASESRRFRVPSDAETERIANAIHYLVEKGFGPEILPAEYVGAVSRLRASPEYSALKSAVPLSEEEVSEFAEAYRLLDNPAHVMARMLHPHLCGKDGELTDEGKGIIMETLELGEKEKVNIDEGALANIATAYSILTGKNVTHYDNEKQRKLHLAMMFMIRSKMKELTGDRIFKPASA